MAMGLTVKSVTGGSQADGKLEPGDIIICCNGISVASLSDLTSAMEMTPNGEDVSIEIERRGKPLTYSFLKARLGVTFDEVVGRQDSLRRSPTTEPSIGETRTERGASSGSSNGALASDYGVAKAVAGFVAFVGWSLVAIGVIAVFVALQQATQSNRIMPGAAVMVALMPGFISAGLGFLLVMGAQVTRAVVDTADYAREILKAVERRAVG